LRNYLILLVALASFPLLAEERKTVSLCHIQVTAGEELSFSDTETKWLCGDPESDAWKSIPLSQKKLSLTSFLQTRGYLQPEFRVERGELLVDAGKKSLVEHFTVTGAPPEWDWSKRRGVIGSVLDPGRLDDNATWAKRSLMFHGYPCPKVEASAFLDRNEILLTVHPGPRQTFGAVGSQGTSDMDPRILERFTAFDPGEYFDLRLLELTSDRILREDLYLSTFYDVICGDDQVARVVRRFVPAAPRLLTFGAGFDTEQGPILRATWKRTRLTRKADSFEATAFLSFREQQLQLKYRNHFPHDPGSRLEFAPLLEVDRQSEKQFETVSYLVEPALAESFEHQSSSSIARFGPLFERTETTKPFVSRVDNLRLRLQAGFMSKMFEYYSNDPREGWRLDMEAWSQLAGVLTDTTIHKLLLKQKMLWNLGNYDPPAVVLGWRGYEATFFAQSPSVAATELPPNDRYFLGGDEDIRGFGRKKLPGNGQGYLTVLYQGIELRLLGVLPAQLQPFAFFDVAKAGYETARLRGPLYYAPGLGVRWASPVGALRASLARGYASSEIADDPVPTWQVFVSLGKEF
jgi:translocation and assembly module TamA